MRKIVNIVKSPEEEIEFSEVSKTLPIFAKEKGILVGMIIKEDLGWTLKTGAQFGAIGHYPKLVQCLESCIDFGYEFYSAE